MSRLGLLSMLVLAAGAAAPDPLVLSGQVLGPDGKPVAGATIVSTAWDAGEPRLWSAVSDAEGRFTLAADPTSSRAVRSLTVLARRPGLALALAQAQPGTPLTLTLGAAAEDRCGVLLAPDGTPAAGVLVSAASLSAGERPPLGLSLPEDALTTVSDREGRFSLPGFPAGGAAEVQVARDGYAAERTRLSDPEPVVIRLRPAVAVTGRVLAGGRPQAGVRVYGSSWQTEACFTSTHTAADGSFALRRLAPGEAAIGIEAPAGLAPLPRRKVTLHPGQPVSGVEFALTPGAVVRGRVTDPRAGQPVPAAVVVLRPPQGPPHSAQTDAQGRYELRVPPGTYRLHCQAPGSSFVFTAAPRPVPPDRDLTLAEGQVVEGCDLTATLPRRVALEVVRPDGTPATGARLCVEGIGASPREPLLTEGHGEVSLMTVATAGSTERWPLCLLATEPERNLAAYVTCPLERVPDKIRIPLGPAATVRVPVADPQGHPLAGLELGVAYPIGEGSSWGARGLTSGAGGLITCACLPTGVQLRLQPRGAMARLLTSTSLSAPLTLAPGEERVLPPLVVDPRGRSLKVFVGDAEGQPVARAAVYAVGLPSPARTDAQGKVELVGLPVRGKVLLLAVHPTEEWYAAETVDPDVGPWPGLLLRPLGTAVATMVGQAGRPLKGLQVYCRPEGRDGFWMLPQAPLQRLKAQSQAGGVTDEQGRWRTDRLVAGVTYALIASPARDGDGYYSGAFKATGGPEVQDLGPRECRLARK